MSELVQKLADGRHRVVFRPVRADAAQELKERVDRGYVLLRFPGTRGGTELGVRLDPERCDLSRADFDAGRGSLRLAGNLTLDWVRVRCVADLDLESMDGEGHLEILADEPAPDADVAPAAGS